MSTQAYRHIHYARAARFEMHVLVDYAERVAQAGKDALPVACPQTVGGLRPSGVIKGFTVNGEMFLS